MFCDNILIIEDTWQVRNLMKKIVKHIFPQYEVLDAENVSQALIMMQESLPCLIITDLEMPDLSGFDLIEILQENEETRDIPVIIVTSHADHKNDGHLLYRLQELGLPPCPVTAKPLDLEDFRAKVAAALQARVA